MDYKEAVVKRSKLIFPGIKTYYDDPLYVIEGRNQYITDSNGNKFLDFYAGVATASCGYCNEYIMDQTIKQLKSIQHIPTLYISEAMLMLAEKLVSLCNKGDYKVMYCNSGSEGIEFLTLLGRLYKNNGYIFSLSHGYHGVTLYSNYLTGINSCKHHGNIKLNSIQVDTPYCYRCNYGLNYGNCDFECAKSVKIAIEHIGVDQFSGILFETVLGVGGVIIPPKEYFDSIISSVKENGGLILIDEVQTGIGRTGRWFGFEHYGIVPDAFCLGKSLGNGLPIGAVIARNELSAMTSDLSMYSTFGGNPVSCAHANATIELMKKENTVSFVETIGKRFLERLQVLYEFDCIGDIRGLGLMIGIEIVKDKKSKEPNENLTRIILNKLKDKLILIGVGGVYKNVIRIAPSFRIDEDDINYFIESMIIILKSNSY